MMISENLGVADPGDGSLLLFAYTGERVIVMPLSHREVRMMRMVTGDCLVREVVSRTLPVSVEGGDRQ